MTEPDPALTTPPPLTSPGAPVTPVSPLTLTGDLAAPLVMSGPRSLKWLWWSLSGVVVAGLFGGGYFAYSRGYIAIPFLTPKEDQLFNRLVDSLTEINNAQYTVQIGLKSEPRSSGATSVFPSADERKAQSNDDKRKSDLASIRTALALFYDDNNSTYPDSIESTISPKYINKLPTDPKDKSPYQYESCNEGKHFLLQTGLESDEYYYFSDAGNSGVAEKVPACGQNSNVNNGLLRLLVPAAQAQATSFSIESVGSQVGLGVAENNYPFLSFLNIFGLGNLESIIDVFPTDIDSSAAITFYTEADKQLQDANALLSINGSYRGDDLTAEFDVEGHKLGSTIYGIIRKFPGIPYLSKYVSPIKNTWVKIEPGDGNPFLRTDTFKQASLKSAVENVRQSFKDALEGNIVTVDKTLGTESIAGVQSAHYRVALHPDKVKAVLEKIVEDRKTKKQSTATLEEAIKKLDKPGTTASLQRLVDNSTVEVWVDKVKGYLRQMSWSIVLVPPDKSEKLKDKQIRLTVTLTLDKVNQNVNVSRPGDAIDYAEAERKVTGISVEEQNFSRQRSRISKIRSALSQMFEYNKVYPESIANLEADLKKATEECKTKKEQAKNTNTNTYVYCDDYLTASTIIVTDIYTKKPYGYTREGDDFRLTYEMKLDFETTKSEFSYGSYYKDNYVEGQNTATSKDESIEKKTASEISNEKYQAERNANLNKNTNTSANTNSSSGYAALTVVPPSITLSAAAGTTLTSKIKVLNSGTITTTVSTEILNAQKAADGKTPVFSPATDRTNFAGWTALTPTTLTLQPGVSAEVSVMINVPAGTTAQTYSGGIMFVQTGTTGIASKVGTLVQVNVSSSTDTTSIDTDSDGVIDSVESTYGSNPALKDTDADGLNDYVEIFTCQTSPTKKDTDGDSYDDRSEILNGYNPNGPGQAQSSNCKSYVTGQ